MQRTRSLMNWITKKNRNPRDNSLVVSSHVRWYGRSHIMITLLVGDIGDSRPASHPLSGTLSYHIMRRGSEANVHHQFRSSHTFHSPNPGTHIPVFVTSPSRTARQQPHVRPDFNATIASFLPLRLKFGCIPPPRPLKLLLLLPPIHQQPMLLIHLFQFRHKLLTLLLTSQNCVQNHRIRKRICRIGVQRECLVERGFGFGVAAKVEFGDSLGSKGGGRGGLRGGG